MLLIPLSVVIITRNEAANIERCISSVKDLTDDIVVVDTNSTDRTVDLAKALGARVFNHEWEGYSKQKNFGIAQTRYQYIFSLDADEALSAELRDELVDLFKTGKLQTLYKVNRFNHFGGQPIKHGAWYPDWHYCLFDKTKLQWIETDEVHENLNWNASTAKGVLKSYLLHYTTPNEQYYRDKMEKYARLFANKMKARGKHAGPLKAYSSAIFRFISEYIFRLGFLDGAAGLKIARAHYVYTRNKYLYVGE